MPAIARNGHIYGGAPTTPVDAEDIVYDNSTSELDSTNVQSAIDELKEIIDEGGGGGTDTTYTLSVGTGDDANKIILTPSTGSPDKVTVPYATSAGDSATVSNHTVATDVPANAVFTDTTYSDATTSASGLMSASDKTTINSLGTAAFRDIPTSGDASTSEVVLGADSRLSDARPASDVSSWAKASTKPTYTASEVGAIASTAKGANNGVAELDENGRVPSTQLPSYVDDVLEYNSTSDFPLTGETGKIYIAKDTNKTYRWSGSNYAEISESLALGETSSTAYAGNKGKANADAIAAIKDGSTIDSFSDVETALASKVDDTELDEYVSSYKSAGNALAYFECSTPNDEINIMASGYVVKNTIKPEITPDLYMIRFTADASETETARLFNYAKNYPTSVIRRNLPINYYDGTAFTRTIHTGDYIIIKLVFNGSLISGGVIVSDHDSTLTGLRSDVQLNTNDITTDSRTKNLLPLTLTNLKARNTAGTWSGNVYTCPNVAFTVNTNDDGLVTSISTTSSGSYSDTMALEFKLPKGTYKLTSGFTETFGSTDTLLFKDNIVIARGNSTSPGQTFTLDSDSTVIWNIRATSSDITAYPMIHLASITDATFAPYIPSVNRRLEAVESSLTNVDVALSVPEGSGKNVLPMTLTAIKAANTSGTWSGNAYTFRDVTFTVITDDANNVVGVSVSGTASADAPFRLYNSGTGFTGAEYILNGCTDGGNSTYDLRVTDLSSTITDTGEGATISSDFTVKRATILIRSGYAASNLLFYPMIRPATITDSTFAPYIPSVESRIEAVESGDYKVIASVTGDGVKTVAQLLPDLFSSVPATTKKCSLIYGKAILPMAEKTTNNAKFGNVSNYQGITSLLSVNIQSSTAYFTEVSIASTGTITVTDRSADVPTNGSVISLVQ